MQTTSKCSRYVPDDVVVLVIERFEESDNDRPSVAAGPGMTYPGPESAHTWIYEACHFQCGTDMCYTDLLL